MPVHLATVIAEITTQPSVTTLLAAMIQPSRRVATFCTDVPTPPSKAATLGPSVITSNLDAITWVARVIT